MVHGSWFIVLHLLLPGVVVLGVLVRYSTSLSFTRCGCRGTAKRDCYSEYWVQCTVYWYCILSIRTERIRHSDHWNEPALA